MWTLKFIRIWKVHIIGLSQDTSVHQVFPESWWLRHGDRKTEHRTSNPQSSSCSSTWNSNVDMSSGEGGHRTPSWKHSDQLPYAIYSRLYNRLNVRGFYTWKQIFINNSTSWHFHLYHLILSLFVSSCWDFFEFLTNICKYIAIVARTE